MSCLNVWRSEYRPRRSLRERAFRLLILTIAVTALCVSYAPTRWRSLGYAWLFAWGGVLWWRPAAGMRLRAWRMIPTGWRLTLLDDTQAYADLVGPIQQWPGLLCLTFVEQRAETEIGQRPRCWRLMLFSDQFSKADWRRLRVSLRWGT